ncbi:AAA family ATPase [Lentibacillus sediminis]|uniref:AAA family ATPase n=1 Tax=Lentibacillus sediminis TaxID=1940529 RepID=UPI000C1BED9A|nr:AAA family ATPase [Lentibacillus sediminis]
MSEETIYVYKKDEYQYYIKNREEAGIPVFSLAKFGIGLEISDVDFQCDIDLTSTIAALTNKNFETIKYNVEQALYQIIENCDGVRFLVESKYNQIVLQELGLFFRYREFINMNKSYDLDTVEKIQPLSKSINKVVDLNKTRLNSLFKTIEKDLVGHHKFKGILNREISMFKFFNTKVNDLPILSVFLLGPSGVGKTEIARILHSFLDQKNPLAKINFANYKSENSLASLIGSPPGYVNSEAESDLVQKINKSNAGVLLVDEFEKADPAAHNFFLQLLEEGKFDDAMGRVHNLNGYIIIFTSNLDKHNYKEKIPPELRSRFNVVNRFNALNFEDKKEFTKNILKIYQRKSGKRMTDSDREEILSKINIKGEDNLRNIQKNIRITFYLFLKEKGKI